MHIKTLSRMPARLLVAALVSAASSFSAFSADASYRILYNSDTTHILSCASEWRAPGSPLSAEMFRKTVFEAADAGADVFLMASGLGWVPWWPSKVLPAKAQSEWFKKRFDMPRARTPFMDFLLAGNDMVKISMDACRERGIAFFVSFRVNDQHGKDASATTTPSPGHMLTIPAFYADNPQFLLGRQSKQASWAAFVQDWSHPEVREYKYRLIEELCRNYDIDGLELDFMRSPFYFKVSETTSSQRADIMVSFVTRVRKLLDETTVNDKRRRLCVRIPSYASAHDAMGVDVAAWHAAGVEMFELSSFFNTEQTTDFAFIRNQAPTAAFYPELTSSIAFNGDTKDRSYRRATAEYLNTAAHLAYTQGAAGVMLFNYQYYRDARGRNTSLKADEPFTEPPFAWIKALGQPEVVSRRLQYYFMGEILYGDPRRKTVFPAGLKPGDTCEFDVDLAPPAGGWRQDARVRLQAAASVPLKNSGFEVRFNGVMLKPTPDVSEPYPNVYTQMRGAADELSAWQLPAACMKAGRNRITVKQITGPPAQLVAIDINAG